LPAAGLLLLIQGIGQVCRCIVCMRTGEWPQQVEDVEEMETMLMHAAEDEAQTKAALGMAGKTESVVPGQNQAEGTGKTGGGGETKA
jgi:hypothetical protein